MCHADTAGREPTDRLLWSLAASDAVGMISAASQARPAKLLKSASRDVVMHVVHLVPVLIVRLDGVQHGLCCWYEFHIAFEQRQGHDLKEAHLHCNAWRCQL